MVNNFTHLHLHTKYSALDGAIKISELADRLVELGMTSCAITDHGSMYGIVEFYKTLKSRGIKPIIGSEFYISPASRFDVAYKKGDTSNYHLVLLAENNIGLQNLYKLSSIGFVEGFYYKPRIDKEVLEKYHEGIIALSACLGGEIPRLFFKKGYAVAKETAIEYDRIMGRGNYFLELQENGIEEQTIVNKQLISISKETGIPLIATSDCHYLYKEDREFHNILMRIQYPKTNKFIKKTENTDNLLTSDSSDYENGIGSEEKDIAEYSSELYLKSFDEVFANFSDIPEAIENSMKIADRCNTSLEFGHLHLPIFDVPSGYNVEEYLRHLADEGLRFRLKDTMVDESKYPLYFDRLEEELTVIISKGFDSYFLIVWDFINYAKKAHIPVGPGRGSGAGSLTAYSIGITDIDPIRFNLIFERFLNPERESMPDFDVDFCINGRSKVIEYVTNKYGSDRVSQIVTFSSLKPRNAVRDIGRALGLTVAEYDRISKLIPNGPSITTFADAFQVDSSLEENINKIDRGLQIVKYGKKIEGLIRQIGLHAAGVVIADKPINEYAPLARGPKKEVIVQFEKDTAEKVGLIKFDFLGLKNLTIIADAVRRIHEQVDNNFDLSKIPLDDALIYEMLQRGESTGVFQLESEGMRSLLKKLRPTVFEDIIAVNALYRPGPINSGMLDDYVERKHGRQNISYIFPEIEDVLKETYGVIVYQEQVMQIARILGGYSLGAADILRRAMGKKKAEIMALEKEKFLIGSPKENIKGAKNLGYDLKKAEAVFDLMAQFAEYGFNKSHSAAYALIAYQTAYLKVHYADQYIPALISGDLDATTDVVKYLSEAKHMGYEILSPSINNSYIDFRYEENDGKKGIRFGLAAIKNVGATVIENYILERESSGKFKSIYDMCSRLDSKSLNKKTLESLIYAGALDCFSKYRSQHLAIFEECLSNGSRSAKLREKGVLSIEDFFEPDEVNEDYPNILELPKKELLFKEKEVLGFFLTDNPLNSIAKLINLIAPDYATLQTMPNNSEVIVVGMIKSVRQHITKKQERMAFLSLICLDGDVDIVVFPSQYATSSHLLKEDQIVVIKGKLDIITNENEEEMNIRLSLKATSIKELGDALESEIAGVILHFDRSKIKSIKASALKSILSLNSGRLPVQVNIADSGYLASLSLAKEYSIKPTVDFITQLSQIEGYVDLESITKSERILTPQICIEV